MRKNLKVGAVVLVAAVAMSAGNYVAPVRTVMAQEIQKENLTEQQLKDSLLGNWAGIGGSITLTDTMYAEGMDLGFGYEEYKYPWNYVGVTAHTARGNIWGIDFNELDVTVSALHYEDAEADYYVYGLLPTEEVLADIQEDGIFVLEKVGKADGSISITMGMANDGVTFAVKKAEAKKDTTSTEDSEQVEEENKTDTTTETEKEEETKTPDETTDEKTNVTTETETEEKESVKSDKVIYTVKSGDTMGFIATNFYGTNANRTRLFEYNKDAFQKTGGKLVVGMELVIPEELGGQKLIPAPEVKDGEKLYVVKSGDSLWKIATAELGNGSLYTKIFERNKDRLTKATMIYEGQVLVIPAK